MSPGHKKQMAQAVLAERLCSGRQACRILRLARATWWYRAGQRSERQQQLVARVHTLSERHPRYGYRRIAAMLRAEGWPVGQR
ncbi:MAG: IS3 family transposase [Candidatus Didemnitutus sp.]|nr:IS3 family transposase [Candidatus Didemnitutus sp.]